MNKNAVLLEDDDPLERTGMMDILRADVDLDALFCTDGEVSLKWEERLAA
jgi:hypothetical protein